MDNTLYWLWLQNSLGFGAKIRELVSFYKDAKSIYEAGEASWRTSGLFGTDLFDIKPAKIENMKHTPLEKGEKTIALCRENGIEIITPENDLYPQNLKLISDYPAVLFVKGDLSCLNGSIPIAVIGTRHPSEYGISAAEKIARELAREKSVIISGGALGIDSIAHRSALAENSKTVLVLGCGHLANYLAENRELRNAVSQNGAVISEYPPTQQATLYNFPKRNRIISGISKGVVIIEAGENSGTLNTAKHAKAQGREIFAVPGDVSSARYAGSNKLITEGANAVFSAKDIISYYRYSIAAMKEIENAEPVTPFDGIDKFSYGEEPKKTKSVAVKRKSATEKAKPKPEQKEEENSAEKIFTNFNAESVSNNANIVYNYMSAEEITLDEVTRACGLPVRKVLTALTELEMAGAIVSHGAGRYVKV